MITYSNDGMIKCWDLTHGKERECVGGRRALNPPPMCVAAVDPTFTCGQFSVLVGCTDEIKMCDLSNIHTNPSAGAIWEGRNHILGDDWEKWIADSIKEFSAHWLYTRDRSDGLTMIHKLANSSTTDDRHDISPADAVRVLRNIIGLFDTEREALKEEEHTGDKSDKALATIGLLSRSGHGDSICPDVGCPVTALTMAMLQDNEDMVSLLLDDYTHQIIVSNIDIPAITFDFTSVQELREAELVRLFEKFPSTAAEFFSNLPLLSTSPLNTNSLVQRGSKCKLDSPENSGAMMSMLGQGSIFKKPGGRGVSDNKWWDVFIDDLWDKSGRQCNRFSIRQKDLAWGEKVQSQMVPIRGVLSMREHRAMRKRESDVFDTSQQTSSYSLLGTSSRNRVIENGDENVADDEPPAMDLLRPFSRLLQAAQCFDEEFGSSHGSHVFSAPVLYHIVLHKWTHQDASMMYDAMFRAYLVCKYPAARHNRLAAPSGFGTF